MEVLIWKSWISVVPPAMCDLSGVRRSWWWANRPSSPSRTVAASACRSVWRSMASVGCAQLLSVQGLGAHERATSGLVLVCYGHAISVTYIKALSTARVTQFLSWNIWASSCFKRGIAIHHRTVGICLWIFQLMWEKLRRTSVDPDGCPLLRLTTRNAQLPLWLTRCHRSQQMFGSPGDIWWCCDLWESSMASWHILLDYMI